jgi:hypothetical protein
MTEEVVALDLGDCLIQRRPDGLFREGSADLFEAERKGELSPDPDDWWPAEHALGALHGGQRFVWGHVSDGVPEKVVVGDDEWPILLAEPLWGCRWDHGRQRVEITFRDRVEVLRLDRPPGYLRSPDETDPAEGSGWFGRQPDADV